MTPASSPGSGAAVDRDHPGLITGFIHRRRRGAELVLLVMSLFVGIGAYAAVGLGVSGEIPTNLFTYGGWLAALVVAAHITIRLRAPYADPILLPIVSALNGLGLAMIHRIDLANTENKPDAHTFADNQLIWMTLGVVLFIGVLVGLRDHRRLQAFTYTSGFAAVVLLLLPLMPGIGNEVNGAKIWIRLGPLGFQPGEIAKLLLVVAFSGYLVVHRDALALAGRRLVFIDLPRGRDLGPIVAMWLISLGILVFQNDLGSSLLFFGLFLVMLYVATERPGWLLVGLLLAVAGVLTAVLLAKIGYNAIEHVQVRVDAWLDPFADPSSSYQIIQGMYGMSWGGLVGRGLGLGDPQITPYSYSDYILPSLGEELGLTGVMAIIVLYGLIVERALRTALICRDNFGKLLATGMAVVFALQVFVVIGGVTKLIPLTGLTTPFMSYGGSSLVANWALIALILRVSDQARRPPPQLVSEESSSDDATQVVKLAMNRPIRNLAVGCAVLFLALLLNATYLQYWQAEQLTDLAVHPDNKRVRDAEFSRKRGAVLVKGEAIAESNKSKDQYKYQRAYPKPLRYSHISGFFSRDYGLAGIEASQNSILSGSDSKLFVNRVIDLVDNQTPEGGNIELTINPDAQKAAYDGLDALASDPQGAVVAIEPSTGKILAMVSTPSYNPNDLATHQFSSVGKAKSSLEERKPSPLDNKAIESVLPPGSTFKLVTAAAALESGKYNPDSMVNGSARLDLPLTKKDLVNESRGGCGGDKITLTRALEVSCNVSFGAIGLDLGGDALREQAEKFGFGDRYFNELDDSLTRQAISQFPANPDKPQTALSAIGQFDVAATPLQMALVAAGIANGGTVMKPYLVDDIQSPNLSTIEKTTPQALRSGAVSARTARDLTQMMTSVVDNGTGRTARINGIKVAGKTGTAQSSPSRPPYAWFVSFAPADDPKVAVAVLVQDAGVARDAISGSGLAAPIARAVMEAVIKP